MGPYPLFACGDWGRLPADIGALGERFVSVTLVTDPLGDYEESLLKEAFPDRMVAFKRHWIVHPGSNAGLPPHHRRHLRRARAGVHVDQPADPRTALRDLVTLYDHLVRRHHLTGIRAFSPLSLGRQLALPGCVVLRARRGAETVGVTVWFETRDRAYYHLGAYSAAGYDVSASYALFGRALEFFGDRGVVLLDLGGGGGASDSDDGLTRFKRGWADDSRTAYLCGRVLNRIAYDRLSGPRVGADVAWFPAYRAREVELRGPGTSKGHTLRPGAARAGR